MSHVPYYGEDWDVIVPPRSQSAATPPREERRDDRAGAAPVHLWSRPAVRGAYFL